MLFRPFKTTSQSKWKDLLDSNLTSAFLVTRRVLKLMGPGSSIVNLSSVAGVVGVPVMSVYSASKAAFIGWSRSLAKELANLTVRVNAVAPGIVRTDMTEQMFRFYTSEQIEKLKK